MNSQLQLERKKKEIKTKNVTEKKVLIKREQFVIKIDIKYPRVIKPNVNIKNNYERNQKMAYLNSAQHCF